MNEQSKSPVPPDGTNKAERVFTWLIVAFVPSAISIPFFRMRHPPEWSATALLFIAAGCCLCSAFGMLSGMRESVGRVILGLLLAGALFVLNVIIVAFVGCSRMNF